MKCWSAYCGRCVRYRFPLSEYFLPALSSPLGYVKDPDKKGHLLVDPETRWIIEKIFDLAVHGRGAASITRILVEEKVPTPGWLNFQRYGTFANIYAGAPEEKA